jgi:uncharacterized protein (DUF1778 family)
MDVNAILFHAISSSIIGKAMRAAALRNTALTDFVLQPALREAKAVIEESERIVLSERDSLTVLKLLENPPAPNAKLRAAIAALPKPTRKRG